jgi:hypothetical protein
MPTCSVFYLCHRDHARCYVTLENDRRMKSNRLESNVIIRENNKNVTKNKQGNRIKLHAQVSLYICG